MEVKINKEIRDYSENICFGLSLRQFFFSVLSCVLTVIVYLLFKNKLGIEITSWLCIFVSVPFIMMGFFKYNGMNMETLIFNFIKSKILVPRKLSFKSVNIYYSLIEEYLLNKKKEELKKK